MATSPAGRRRYGPSLAVLALLAGLILLGLWGAWPPPPPSPDDPQPVVEVWRNGRPHDLLLALPLVGQEHLRVRVTAPHGLRMAVFAQDPTGKVFELTRVSGQSDGKVNTVTAWLELDEL